ncbi:MAG: hypothetical protein ACYSW3_01915 [Planctomycetota bacterium]
MKNKATELGFRELRFQQSGIDEALEGNTILVFCNNKPAANVIQRYYYMLMSEKGTNIKKADTLKFHFYGGGRILILYATKKQKLGQYNRDTTYFRLDWRR